MTIFKRTTFLLIILFSINSLSQENFKIENENYYSNVYVEDENTLIEIKRKADSLHLKFKMPSSFEKAIKKYYDRNNTNEIALIFKKDENNNYKLFQLVFINKNEKINIHTGTEDIYNIYLNDYKIETLVCKNCLEQIEIIVYKKALKSN